MQFFSIAYQQLLYTGFKTGYGIPALAKKGLFVERDAFYRQHEFITLPGKTIRTSTAEMKTMIINRHFVLFVGLIAFMFFFDMHGLSDYLPRFQLFLYWVFATVNSFAFYIFGMLALSFIHRKIKILPPYLPLASIGTLWMAIGVNKLVLWMFTGMPVPSMAILLAMTGKVLIVVFVLEILYFEFVHPTTEAKYLKARSLEEILIAEPKQKAYAPRTVKVSEKTLLVDNICMVRARDHYVEIYFHDGSRAEYYCKISELVGQTHQSWGISPHRSYWVERKSILARDVTGGKHILSLEGDLQVPVSRNNRQAVVEWLKKFRPDIPV